MGHTLTCVHWHVQASVDAVTKGSNGVSSSGNGNGKSNGKPAGNINGKDANKSANAPRPKSGAGKRRVAKPCGAPLTLGQHTMSVKLVQTPISMPKQCVYLYIERPESHIASYVIR